ncbi:hypothetical protein Q427_21210 [Halomonas sp. BC04]|nr:hypothetical protein Q427_21210 [Halomonas sp. BC04]
MTASFPQRIDAFRIARLPDIQFGAGGITRLPG